MPRIILKNTSNIQFQDIMEILKQISFDNCNVCFIAQAQFLGKGNIFFKLNFFSLFFIIQIVTFTFLSSFKTSFSKYKRNTQIYFNLSAMCFFKIE